MFRLIFLFLCLVSFYSLFAQQTDNAFETVTDSTVINGAERTSDYLHLLKNKRVAMVVNHTSMIDSLHEADSLSSLGVNITTIFAPEHGFRGNMADGAHVQDHRRGRDIQTFHQVADHAEPHHQKQVLNAVVHRVNAEK